MSCVSSRAGANPLLATSGQRCTLSLARFRPAFTSDCLSPPLSVALLTEEGDTDLYVSTVTKEPNYLDYQYYSASCGLDLVVVPTSKGAESQRVYLSVVGHSHHAESQYKLAIITASFQDISKFQVRL